MSESITGIKYIAFAIRILKMYKVLREQRNECVLSKQVLRSGTSIGALLTEAEHAQSTADFINKVNVALKEANETNYWLLLLKESNHINEKEYESIHKDCIELIKLAAKIVKTTKVKNNLL